jgi:Cd2+/Zn2+-exporting ATPase
MNSERELSISLQATPDADSRRCAEHFQSVLQAEPGIRGAELDMQGGRLRLRFNPRLVSQERIQGLARRLGIELGEDFQQCALRIHGVRCSDCSQGLIDRLAQIPGVTRASVDAQSGAIALEYEPPATDLQTVEQVIGRETGPAEAAPHSRAALQLAQAQQASARRRMAVLAAVCLTAWLLGLMAEKTNLANRPFILTLYSIAYVAGGFYSTVNALRQLRRASVNVDLLMVLAALGAAAVGDWPEGAFLLFLFSASSTLEQYVLGRTRRAIEALMDLSPEEAVVRRNGEERQVPVAEVRLGDRLIIRPAERIAADGRIVAGATSIDQSALTGESIPVDKGVDDCVFAGTLNQQGAIEVEVTRLAGDSALARVVQLVEEAQTQKAESQRFTEWFGSRYTLGVLAAAALTLVLPLWFFGESFAAAFYRAMTVLVVASPCAVVISIPAAILAAITRAARAGVLFKGGAHLERAAAIQAMAFDKTGTLTVGRPRLVDLRAADGMSGDEVLRLAASAEGLSEHPLAHAILEAARSRRLELLPATNVEAIIGKGLRAQIGTRSVWVGKPSLFTERGLCIPEPLGAIAASLAAEGKTTLLVGDDQTVLGVLAVADTLRPGAAEAIQQLRALGIERLIMLTGDNRMVAKAIADRLGMDYEAELLPEDKLLALKRLREQSRPVAMVGDGINDAPSLAAADVGVSLGSSGTDVALETADVVLMGDDLRNLPFAVSLARRTQRIIKQNLVFAFAVMAALLGLTYFGSLPLPAAVVGHEGSTVLVIFNALRLLRFSQNS